MFKTQNPRVVLVFQGVSMVVWLFVADLLLGNDGVRGALVQGLIAGLLFVLISVIFPSRRAKSTDD